MKNILARGIVVIAILQLFVLLVIGLTGHAKANPISAASVEYKQSHEPLTPIILATPITAVAQETEIYFLPNLYVGKVDQIQWQAPNYLASDTVAVPQKAPPKPKRREKANCRCTIWDLLQQLFQKDPGRKKNTSLAESKT